MFEIDDDFDIDEEFLAGVLAVEKDVQSKFAIGSGAASQAIYNDESPESKASKRRKCESHHDNDSNSSCTTSLDTAGGSELDNFILGITPAPSCATLPKETVVSARGLPEEKGVRPRFARLFHCESEASTANESSLISSVFEDDALHARDGGVQRENTHFLSSTARNENESGLSSNIRNQREILFPSDTPKKLERKFPGPAGLLPERRKQRVPFRAINNEHAEIDGEEDPDGEPLCSQSATSRLEESPWLTLKSAYTSDLLDRFTIAWVKRKAASRQLVGQKVPFLAAVLQSLDCSTPDPSLVLRDSTGEIPGTLHRTLWDRYEGQLTPGSGIVLQLVGVLIRRVARRTNCYLIITENNLIAIYSTNNSFALPSLFPSHATADSVRVTQVHEVPITDLRQIAREWEEESRKLKKRGCPTRASVPQPTTSLLNTVIPNVQPWEPEQVPRSTVHFGMRGNCSHSAVSSSAAKTPVVSLSSRHSTKETFKSPSTFVAKKPSLVLQSSSNNIPENTEIIETLESLISTVDFDDADDLELSSVLDGMDCSTAFGR